MRALMLFAVLATPAFAQDSGQSKLGPNAIPVTQDAAYLRRADAPDYWALSVFVKPQFTTSACSIAAVTATLNGLQGLPDKAADTVMTQQALLELTGSADWAALSAEGGDGVTFDQLVDFTGAAIAARQQPLAVTAWKPDQHADGAPLDRLRAILASNEASANDAAMIYFNQGVVTGDWDGPHVSLIGAYDAEKDAVLILEVDQEWYVPYWTPVPVLLDALTKPTSAEHGVLEGETGGVVIVAPA